MSEQAPESQPSPTVSEYLQVHPDAIVDPNKAAFIADIVEGDEELVVQYSTHALGNVVLSATGSSLDLSKFFKGTDLSNLKDSEKRQKLREIAETTLGYAKEARIRADDTVDKVGKIYDQTQAIKSGKKVE